MSKEFTPTMTSRGFERIDFTDAYGEKCSLQQSSGVDDCCDSLGGSPGTSLIWLGVDDPKPMKLVFNEGWKEVPLPEGTETFGRMHLNREQVSELIEYLQAWLDTGHFQPA